MSIKPIETEYNGYRFRSRLEARWAVFFDALGVDYEYEPEGFDLGDGIYYLPDFLIHNVIPRYKQGNELKDLYVEVKGKPSPEDAKKITAFAKHLPIWVVGQIPDPNDYISSCKEQHDEYCRNLISGDYGSKTDPCALCPYCHAMIDGDWCFEFSLGYDFNTLSFHGADGSYDFGVEYKEIKSALLKARQARFEHGETPRKETSA